MSDKKTEIIPINMVYQSNNRLQNCKVLINRSEGNLVNNFDIPTSSNLMQGAKTSLSRLQPTNVVKVNSANHPIVRTLGSAKMASVGRILPGCSQASQTLIMQPGKSILIQQPLQKQTQQTLQQQTLQQQTLQQQTLQQQKLQQQTQQQLLKQHQNLQQQPLKQHPNLQQHSLQQQSLQQTPQQQFQPISLTQTILIPQPIKSPNHVIYQALPLSTTQRINKSFIRRSNSNTAIDTTTTPNNNFNSSCNNLSINNITKINNNNSIHMRINNNNINNNFINNNITNNVSNNITNNNVSNNTNNSIINNSITNNNITNNNITNNTNNSATGPKIYRVLGSQAPHIKTTSIIKPSTSAIANKSKSMPTVNTPQQLNKSSHQPSSTQRLILPATNTIQMSIPPNHKQSPHHNPPPSPITYIGSSTTPLSNKHHLQNHHSNKKAENIADINGLVISNTSPSNHLNNTSNNLAFNNNNNNNVSFTLVSNSAGTHFTNRSEPSATTSNNNNVITHNNVIDLEATSFNNEIVQGYRKKVSDQQMKQQNWLSSIESNLRQRKPCNCTKSQCLKLYCECFANGEFCKDCNCCNCANNLEHEDERARAVRNCIERNPHAFHPKIGKGGSNRHHNKGCNCKRSGCLKNYCECYEAKILCSHLCRCVGCRNYEESSDRQKLMQLADVAEARVQQQTAADNKLSMHILGAASPVKPQALNGQRPPYTFVTLDVIEAISSCLIAEADDHEGSGEALQERHVLEEFGRCLSQVIEMASKSKASSP